MNSLILLLAASLGQTGPVPAFEEASRTALGQAGLRPETARFDGSILPFYRQGEFATPFYTATHENPWRIPFMMQAQRRQLLASQGRPLETIGIVSRLLGDGASRELLGNPIQPAVEKARRARSLESALQRMKTMNLIPGAIPSVADVPEPIQKAAAVVIEASLDAWSYRKAAFANVPNLAEAFRRDTTQEPNPDDAELYQRQLALGRQVEMAYLYSAAQEVATAATEARALAGVAGRAASFDFRVQSEWGQIRLTGSNINRHDETPTFVAIDSGGDDVWMNPASSQTVNNWVSVCIDLSGKDQYLSHPSLGETTVAAWPQRGTTRRLLGPAAASFGITVLLDVEGDDVYRSARPGLGAASYGCSVLLDLAGDDSYESYADGQGWARFGIGILEDISGKDTYSGFSQVQGVGMTRGAGLLLDRAGNDRYDVNRETIDFPSAQDATQNYSMAQGAGVGFRSDFLNGKSQAGGIGILYDLAGDDEYVCGVFGQGVGYWMGVGALWDDTGADRYQGSWYTMGSGSLFGVGYLEDQAGDDRMTATGPASLGVGVDFAVGFLLNGSGKDVYQGGNLCLGAGSENGIGLMVDIDGDDEYRAGGVALGSASEASKGSLRERALGLGLFMDLAGVDTYPASSPWMRNGALGVNWRDRLASPAESQLGIYWDRQGS